MDEQSVASSVQSILEMLPAGVTLVAAAKGRTADEVRAAIRAGVSHVGHNYVQEALHMIPHVPEPVVWHMIGHLQTNKAGAAVELFDMVQTVDSERLALELDRRARAAGRVLPVLLEVNTSGEQTKFGVSPDDAPRLAEVVAGRDALRLEGLMTIGRLGVQPHEARPDFALLRELFERIAAALPGAPMRWLSMGMSADFEVAIEEGSNMVRVGAAVFGPRPTDN